MSESIVIANSTIINNNLIGKSIMHDEIEKIKSRLKVGSYCFHVSTPEDNHVRYSMGGVV